MKHISLHLEDYKKLVRGETIVHGDVTISLDSLKSLNAFIAHEKYLIEAKIVYLRSKSDLEKIDFKSPFLKK